MRLLTLTICTSDQQMLKLSLIESLHTTVLCSASCLLINANFASEQHSQKLIVKPLLTKCVQEEFSGFVSVFPIKIKSIVLVAIIHIHMKFQFFLSSQRSRLSICNLLFQSPSISQASWFLDMIRSVAALSTGEVLVPTVPARNALQLWAPDFRCVLRELSISACPDAFVYNFKSGDLVSCLRDAIELQTVPSLSTQAFVGSGLAMAGGSTATILGLPSRSSGSKTDLQSANKENATGSSGSKKAQRGALTRKPGRLSRRGPGSRLWPACYASTSPPQTCRQSSIRVPMMHVRCPHLRAKA